MEVKVNAIKHGRSSFFPGVSLLAVWVMSILLSPVGMAQKDSDYLNYTGLTGQLNQLVSANKQLMKLETIGKTAQNRDIWLLSMGAGSQGDWAERPAILVAANLEANQPVGSELVLKMIEGLAQGYGNNEAIRHLLDQHVVYFLPRVNPDGAEAFLGGTTALKRTNTTPYDGDNDGRIDEDGPEDLNQDGLITLMRVVDPEGKYFEDPDHPGLLKVADPTKGETGKFTIYWEGRDNDGDGFINEDPVGGVDINRNFAHEYPYYQADAGVHMVSEKETRAIMDWILQHRNIAIMLTFGENDNLLTAPDTRGRLATDREISLFKFADAATADASKKGMVSSRSNMRFMMFGGFMGGGRQTQGAETARSGRPGRQATTTYNTADLVYYTKVSDLYKEKTGIKKAPALRNPKGAFSEYGYFQYGILSMTSPGWGIPEKEDTTASDPAGRRGGREAGGRGSAPRTMPGGFGGPAAGGTGGGVDADLLNYFTEQQVDGFMSWTAFTHPDLGAVELGGFKAFRAYNPPMSVIDDLAAKQTDFLVSLGELFAQVEITKTEVVNHGDGIFRIKASVSNTGFLPTSLQHGVDSRSVKPTMVQLGIDPELIISGNDKTSFIRKLDGSGVTESFEWLVKGKKGDKITLRVVAQKAGQDEKTIELR